MSENKRHFQQQVVQAAAAYISPEDIVGCGSGATVDYFIQHLSGCNRDHHPAGIVAASLKTEHTVRQYLANVPLISLNDVDVLPLYIDSADEIDGNGFMIKGGGGASTREKIIATVAKTFVCMVDHQKYVVRLGKCAVAVEVIPMARSYVARYIMGTFGANVRYREHFVTDNHHIILDVTNLDLSNPLRREDEMNSIPGVVDCGLFAHRRATIILVAGPNGTRTYHPLQRPSLSGGEEAT